MKKLKLKPRTPPVQEQKKPVKKPKKIIKKHEVIEETIVKVEEKKDIVHVTGIAPRFSDIELIYPKDVCFNPTRFLGLDCEGCQFTKKCVAICKFDYKQTYARKRVQEEEEASLLADPFPISTNKAGVKPKPVIKKEKIKEEIKTPLVLKPKLKSKIKHKISKDDYKFVL